MNRGYIALWRKIQDSQIWQERRKFSKAEAWIDILMNVRWSNEPEQVIIGNRILTCGYGESLRSLDTWAKRWGWSTAKVHRVFGLMAGLSMIRVKNETVTTRITVLNYSRYNVMRNDDETQMKRKRNASETQMKTEEESKEGKELKHKILSASDDAVIENSEEAENQTEPNGQKYSEEFKKAWKNHGTNKGSKYDAFKKWKQLKRDHVLPSLGIILNAQDRQKKSKAWKDGYIPHLVTWLNGRRWEDEDCLHGIEETRQPNGFDAIPESEQSVWMDKAAQRRPELAGLQGALRTIAEQLYRGHMHGQDDPPASH